MNQSTEEREKFAAFVAAQDRCLDQVRRELRAGRKESHWIWFIFPQLAELGFSSMSRKFGIDSLDEARSYLAHDVLGPRLQECTRLILATPRGANIGSILGAPDNLKFRSCMTLFALAAPGDPLFKAALDRFFGGEYDSLTLQLLRQTKPHPDNAP